jgi:hypothetical protein
MIAISKLSFRYLSLMMKSSGSTSIGQQISKMVLFLGVVVVGTTLGRRPFAQIASVELNSNFLPPRTPPPTTTTTLKLERPNGARLSRPRLGEERPWRTILKDGHVRWLLLLLLISAELVVKMVDVYVVKY